MAVCPPERATRGSVAPLINRGAVSTFTIVLENDIEVHLVSLIVDGAYSISLFIEVCHFYPYHIEPSCELEAPKWMMANFYREFERWRLLFCPKATRRRFVDVELRRLVEGTASDSLELKLLMHQAALRLLQILSVAQKRELLLDFAEPEDVSVDIQRTVEILKAHPKFLIEKNDGPIRIAGREFTTTVQAWSQQTSNRLDLSVLVGLLSYIDSRLIYYGFPITIIDLVERCRVVALRLSDIRCRGSSSGRGLRSFLRSSTRSAIGARIKQDIEILLALLEANLERSDLDTLAFNGLWLGKRDYEVFEDLVYAGVCKALGYDESQIRSRSAKLEGLRHSIVNVNFQGGKMLLEQTVAGWRSTSKQPAEYEPDFLVLYEGSKPIVVDAKFRLPNSFQAIVNAQATSQIQAYWTNFRCLLR